MSTMGQPLSTHITFVIPFILIIILRTITAPCCLDSLCPHNKQNGQEGTTEGWISKDYVVTLPLNISREKVFVIPCKYYRTAAMILTGT